MRVKLEFIANDGKRAAYFLVAEEVRNHFIKFLDSKKVDFVFGCGVKPCLTDGGGNHFEFVIQAGIPPQDGNLLVSEFLASNQI